MAHTRVSKLTIIGSDNSLAPRRHEAINGCIMFCFMHTILSRSYSHFIGFNRFSYYIVWYIHAVLLCCALFCCGSIVIFVLCDLFIHILWLLSLWQSYTTTTRKQWAWFQRRIVHGIKSSVVSPDSKVCGANMGPTWGRQDSGGPHVGHMNLAVWVWMNCEPEEQLKSNKL